MIYKDDVTENSNMTDLLTWMIKLKPSSTNQISPFVSLSFAKAIVEWGYVDYGKDSKRVGWRTNARYFHNIKQT